MTFQDAIKTCLLKKYADFEGRALRSEYWWFWLFCFGTGIAVSTVAQAAGLSTSLGALFSLALLLPSLAVGTRRLHDIDKSGFWLLICFVPFVGVLVLLYWLCQKGTAGANRFGAEPAAT